MLKYVLLLAIAIAAVHAHKCDYNKLTCEWKTAFIPWVGVCPPGERPKVRAFWGRLDNDTCTDQVRSEFLQTINCPDSGMTSDAITAWCEDSDNIKSSGMCKIRAANVKVGGDPCVHTFKYLRTCTYCVPEKCDYDQLTCEWKTAFIPWVGVCPAGQRPKVRAFWGRLDNTTCTEQVRSEFLQTINCPDSGMTSNAITTWCEDPANIKSNGMCKIRAANVKVGGDPCVHTFKYLRTCTYCEDKCDPRGPGNLLTCEWKTARFPWGACPNGLVRKARAAWGRDGDNTTCVDQVPGIVLQNLNCPGDDDSASAAVTAWCNDPNHIKGNGDCKVRAANKKVAGVHGDPCVGTFKYLRTCTYCGFPDMQPGMHPPHPPMGP